MIGAKALIIGSLFSAVVITALWYRGSFHAARAEHATAALDASIEVSNANAEAASHYAAEADRFAAITGKTAEKKDDIRRKSEANKLEIISAPPSDDGPVAPVLRRWLDRLPNPPRPDPICQPGAPACVERTASAEFGPVPAGAERDTARRDVGP